MYFNLGASRPHIADLCVGACNRGTKKSAIVEARRQFQDGPGGGKARVLPPESDIMEDEGKN